METKKAKVKDIDRGYIECPLCDGVAEATFESSVNLATNETTSSFTARCKKCNSFFYVEED